MRAALRAYAVAYGTQAELIRSGGTLPAVSLLADRLGVPPVLMGFSPPGERWHAPDEHLHLRSFSLGIDTAIWFLAEMAKT